MKYIRTKGEILENTRLNMKQIGGGVVEILYLSELIQPNIISQADTIEELCDEFVALGYGLKGKPAVVNGNNGFKTIKTMLSNYEIYGAIWTDKGLIYVAKMNEKGEMELL